jgi:ectoine hydroxylase-related dioxygenase (phytanoyl-CoA dioxygenase family)
MERVAHPWSIDFEWLDHSGPFTTISVDQARSYDDAGFFVFEGAFDLDQVSALSDALAPGNDKVASLLRRVADGRFSVAGLDTQVVAPHAVLRSDVARAFCAHPTLGGIARDILGPDARLYWDQSVFKVPQGKEPVLWHQDNGYAYVEPQSYLTCWVVKRPGICGGSDLPIVSFRVLVLSQAVCWVMVRSNSIGET